MNSQIHILEALAEFSRVEKSARPSASGWPRLLAIVRDKDRRRAGGVEPLPLPRLEAPPPRTTHSATTSRRPILLVEAAEALGQARRPEAPGSVARSLVDHALDWGWDARHGGFFDKGDSFGQAAYDTTKIWWTQAEGLNALLLMHRRYGDETPRYWDAFRKQWDFIDRHQIDHARGGWSWETLADGSPLGAPRKANQWKANYHTARAMMNVSTMLRASEAKGR